MKRFLMATAVACVLATTTLSGDIPSVGAPSPQPQQMPGSTPLGDIPSGGNTESISDAAIAALLTALGLASI